MTDHASAFMIVTVLAIVLGFFVFGMKFFTSIRVARLRAAGDEAYRDLAARAVKAQEEGASAVASLKAGLQDIEARLARVENVLKEVE